ncbi:hypothetical protein C4D60_Mb06t02750 [Musa balbisiana]|uniref:Uncharacterized protein n=1 Tax=Musa balbisiana TaxID=52838 RepID=A0A4S8IK64_MUSBA|nr:hypothetical protein C4D60_Mb06t02750 [Musa balbisiana]
MTSDRKKLLRLNQRAPGNDGYIDLLLCFLGFPSFDGPNSPSIPDRSETATAREGRKRTPAAAMEDGAMMGRQTRKWMVLMATVWIQAFTGTNFDFSAYSSDLKAAMGISQVQLNYLATASDLGKALGWSSGLALLYLPLPFVLLLAAAVGFGAYGAQWLLITHRISLPYFPVFLLCLLAGCSICWFNTVCFVLCVRNFPVNRSLALSLTTSFNGVSASLYTLVVNAVGGSCSVYLLLNATLPLLVSTIALLPIVRQPPTHLLLLAPANSARHDSYIFLLLNILAFITGLYLLFLNSISSVSSTARLLLAGAVLLLLLPLCVPGVICARDWARRTIFSSSLFSFIGVEDLELKKQLVQSSEDDIDVSVNNGDAFNVNDGNDDCSHGEDGRRSCWWWWCWCCDRLAALGDEHTATRLVSRGDFWLYYVSYFCAATVGLVYSNNLGQIAQSMGRQSQTTCSSRSTRLVHSSVAWSPPPPTSFAGTYVLQPSFSRHIILINLGAQWQEDQLRKDGVAGGGCGADAACVLSAGRGGRHACFAGRHSSHRAQLRLPLPYALLRSSSGPTVWASTTTSSSPTSPWDLSSTACLPP